MRTHTLGARFKAVVHNRVSGVLGVLGRHEGGGRTLPSCVEWPDAVLGRGGAVWGLLWRCPVRGLAALLRCLRFLAPSLLSQRNVWLQDSVNKLYAW